MTELLIERGADINKQDPNGYTALHLATKAGHKDIVRLLLVKGANRDLKYAKYIFCSLMYATSDSNSGRYQNWRHFAGYFTCSGARLGTPQWRSLAIPR
jgi:ankyrin repeat protein